MTYKEAKDGLQRQTIDCTSRKCLIKDKSCSTIDCLQFHAGSVYQKNVLSHTYTNSTCEFME